MLEINAKTLKTTNSKGIVTDLTPREANHAVCVIGWKNECWIVRNSWGDMVPIDVPKDLSCVVRGENKCSVSFEKWNNMLEDPGFVLLPFDYAPLHNKKISPWIYCGVVV